MRDLILAIIEPRVREFAEQLADQVVARVAVMVGQLEFSFEAALSSFESDLARTDSSTDSRPARATRTTRASTNDPAEGVEGSAPRAPGNSSAPPASSASGVTAALAVRGGGRLSPRSAVPEPAVAAEQGSTSSRRKPSEMRVQRRDVLRDRAEALRDAPPQRSQWLEPDDDEPVAPMRTAPTLPTARGSYNIDGDIVRGVDEPVKGRRGRPRLAETLTPEQLEAHRARTKARAKERAKARAKERAKERCASGNTAEERA